MPDFSVAIGMLKKPIEDLYSVAKDELKSKIAAIRTTAKVKQLHSKLYETQRVKTIWHTDRPCSLSSFFHPVSIVTDESSVIGPFRLNGLDAFKNNHNIIFGTVGQGKSILLRYLLGKEIKSGTRVPIFFELRNIEKGTLHQALVNKFAAVLNIAPDEELFEFFARSGKISFLLDGFDEVDPASVMRVLTEIEDFSFQYDACKIALTSRPDSECRHLTNFYSNRIQPLGVDDLLAFYKKITRDPEFSNRLQSAVKTSPTKIKELVITPLLATLLAISYRSAQKIPLDFSEFYDELFQILLIRHDASKLGWRRNRKSKLDDRQIQQIFEAFCFATRRKMMTSLDRELAYGIAVDSIAEVNISAEPQNFLDDIKKITCLLVDEGKKSHFVHASVQEFFAARYIKNRTDVVAESFYKQLLGGRWSSWTEELNFLRQIDSYRSSKYFYLPDIKSSLDVVLEGKSVSNEVAVSYLSKMFVNRVVVTRDDKKTVSYQVFRDFVRKTHYLSVIDSRIFSSMFSFRDAIPGWRIGFDLDPLSMQRSYLQIAMDRGSAFRDEMVEKVKATLQDMLRTQSEMTESVRRQEDKSSFIDLSIS